MEQTKKMCDICTYAEDDKALYGEMIFKDELQVHSYCLLSGYNIIQRGKDNQGINGFLIEDIEKAWLEFQDNHCFLCQRDGAAVKCSYEGCEKYWHFRCGRINDCITQFIGEHKSFCNLHVPDTNVIQHNGICCFVCDRILLRYHPAMSIYSECCLKTALKEMEEDPNYKDEHSQKFVCCYCVQRYTEKAGYDSMCIMCNMKSMTREEYQNQMRRKGIFVPMDMAEWEKDGIFKDHVKNKCLHPNCPNPSITRNVWTCRVCGCHPRHLSCARVESVEEYLCPQCIDQSFVQRVPLL